MCQRHSHFYTYMLHVKVSEARELGKMWGISRCEKLMVFRAKNAFCHNPL